MDFIDNIRKHWPEWKIGVLAGVLILYYGLLVQRDPGQFSFFDFLYMWYTAIMETVHPNGLYIISSYQMLLNSIIHTEPDPIALVLSMIYIAGFILFIPYFLLRLISRSLTAEHTTKLSIFLIGIPAYMFLYELVVQIFSEPFHAILYGALGEQWGNVLGPWFPIICLSVIYYSHRYSYLIKNLIR